MKKSIKISTALILLTCMALAASTATVRADQAVSVYIMDPTNPANGAKGLTSGGYWVGEIPITITGNSAPTYQTVSYCIDFDRNIYIGNTYPATITVAVDDAEWRSVSYLLSWSYPATNNQAAADQVAIWRLLNQTRGSNYYVESWLDQGIDNAGNALAAQAIGKDVVRQNDLFQWVTPITANMSGTPSNPGETVSFTAKLTNSTGSPRPNVRVLFNVTSSFEGVTQVLNSTYVTPAETFTNNLGLAQVNVTVPGDSQYGAILAVQAQTQSIWPQRYIDVTDPSSQNLLGIGETYQLTLSTNVCVIGYITVLPESPLGTIAAIGACGGGFAAWVKIKKYKKGKA